MIEGESLKFEGVASSQVMAKNAIKDGTYLVCPINLDVRYDENIASEGFSNAIIVKAMTTDNADQMLAMLTSLDTLVRDTMIPQLQPIVSADLIGLIGSLTDRVEALESS